MTIWHLKICIFESAVSQKSKEIVLHTVFQIKSIIRFCRANQDNISYSGLVNYFWCTSTKNNYHIFGFKKHYKNFFLYFTFLWRYLVKFLNSIVDSRNMWVSKIIFLLIIISETTTKCIHKNLIKITYWISKIIFSL